MALVKIDDIHLYGGLTENVSDCYRVKKWLNDNDITNIHLFYTDENQCKEVIESVSGWFNGPNEPVTILDFPFIVYCEVHDDMPISHYPRKVLSGYDEITSKLKELYTVGR